MTIDLRERATPILDPAPIRRAARRGFTTAPDTRVRQTVTISLVAISSVGAALLSDASPAGIAMADAMYRGVFAGTVVWFAGRARRWTWPVLAGLAAVSTASLLGQVACVIALGLTARSVNNRRRRSDRLVGSVVAAVAVPALLTQGAGPLWRLSGGHIEDPFATSAMITLVATVPVLMTGWKTLSRRRRRMIRGHGRRLAWTLGLTILMTAAISAISIPSMLDGLRTSRSAAEAASDGDLLASTELFDEAADDWASANRVLAGPWMTPSRLIPILGQHVRAAQVVTGQASALTSSAAVTTQRVRPDELFTDGAINVNEVESITPAVDALAATTERANSRIDRSRSPWLVPPLANRMDRAVEVLGRSSGLVGASAEALHVSANLLGRDTASQILVMISTPAEARAMGGFVGNWVLLESRDGTLSVAEQYQARDLNALLETHSATLQGDAEFVARYQRYSIDRHIQDVTISPDFPSVARVSADLFAQATGIDVEAILLIDPFVIEGLLGFAEPIDLDGDMSLTGANASRELLVEQYARFEDDEPGREQRLLDMTDQLVDSLIENPPDPIAFATELAPLAEQRRISLWLADDEDGSIVERLGLSGAFPRSPENVLAIVHQNAGQNKIDPYLERTVDLRTTVRPETEQVVHDVTIMLENTAPSSGLPDAVLASNDQDLDLGTNRMILSIYSSDILVDALVDGDPAPVEVGTEFGHWVYSMVVTIPPGEFATLDLELEADLSSRSAFELTVGSQPLSSPDKISWRVSTDDGSRIVPPAGWTSHADGVRWAAPLDRPAVFSFMLAD